MMKGVSTMWFLPEGQLVSERYEIRSEIGRGGMGVVYHGFDQNLQREVAIKFLDPEHSTNEEAVSRFQREAISAGRIGHENICDVRDRGTTADGAPYIVMELLEGESISQVLEREGKLDIDRAIEIVVQVLSGLEAAHQAGIIHRDLKPENIFLAQSVGGRERVKLLDFGISKYLGEATELRLTKTGYVMGSPYYMSPEQAKGRADIDHRTDIWSVGVVLFEMLTGALPFGGENYNEVMINIVTVEPPDPVGLNPEIPRELGDVILRALAEEPEQRFDNASDFASALAEATGRADLVAAAFGGQLPPPTPSRSPRRRRRLRQLRLGLAGLTVVLVGALAGVLGLMILPRSGASPDAAEPEGRSEPGEGTKTAALAPAGPVEVTLVNLPPGATVTFEGEPVTGNVVAGEPGQFGQLRVEAEGYEPCRIDYTFVTNRELDLSGRLVPVRLVAETNSDAGAEAAEAGSSTAETEAAPEPRRPAKRTRGRSRGRRDEGPASRTIEGRHDTKITLDYDDGEV